MADIRMEREFAVTPARLFEVLSTHSEVIRWWGHEDWTFRDENLDLSKPGPWHSSMISEEGNLYKISGEVTRVSPPEILGFTWGWHDPDDQRGPESHVTFTVQETAKGAKLIIDHRDLPTDDIAEQHRRGWGNPLSRLERYLET